MENKLIFTVSILMLNLYSCSSGNNEREDLHKASNPIEIDNVMGIARIEPQNGLLSIYATASGRITEIIVSENQEIKENSPMLLLDNDVEKRLLQIEESKIEAQNKAIEVANINAELVKNDLNKALSDLSLNEKLFLAKGITEQTLNDSKSNAHKASTNYEKAKIEQQQQYALIKEVKANIQYRQVLLNEKILLSSTDGRVLQWDVHKGDYINLGDKIGQYAPSGSLVAVTEIDELFQDKIKIGMTANIYSQTNGECIGYGTVIYIANLLKKKSLFSDENAVEDRRVQEVKILLDDDSKTIINSKVDCVVNVKK